MFEVVTGTDLFVIALGSVAGVLVVVTWMLTSLRGWLDDEIDWRVEQRLQARETADD